MPVNPMDYNSKDLVLDVVRTESTKFFDIVDQPQNWNVQTRCEDWEVRDVVGHMIDVTEGYLSAWDVARQGGTAQGIGLVDMGRLLNEHAQAFRSLSRDEAVNRLKSDYNKMMATFDSLSADEWGGFNVPHPYMGPLPTLFYPAFHIMDYGVHTWDMRWGLGEKSATLDERTAGVLTPYMFILMQATVDQEVAKGVNATFGIKVDGEWGGQWRVTVKDGTFTYAPADNLDDVQAVFHYKSASDFVLTTYQRFQAWEATGDPQVIDQVSKLFFRI
ncbi:MAG TPA: maleylpyruvate isomerase N-terminal domain-containing protein [Ktedonobacteraceae bacterium]|nr:maleylpyruvate isomerase N-terminal domain-containing protein [Ktedonobacteraceae bacterium]